MSSAAADVVEEGRDSTEEETGAECEVTPAHNLGHTRIISSNRFPHGQELHYSQTLHFTNTGRRQSKIL